MSEHFQLSGVLVTDLVDSTNLRQQLGDSSADQRFNEHDEVLVCCAARFGGRVAQWHGDGMLALFPNASSAAYAGIAIQQAISRINARHLTLPMSIRIGACAGEVQRDGESCYGATIDNAFRLCQQAEPGEIWVSNHLVKLAGSRLELKLPDSDLSSYPVAWHPLAPAADRMNLAAALRTEGQLPFVGRESELSQLKQYLTQSADGQGRLVFLQGDAGSGKTRLAAELAQVARAQGFVVLYGAAAPDIARPFEPFYEALNAWVNELEDGFERLGLAAVELDRLLPMGQRINALPPPVRSSADTERQHFYAAVSDWLGSAAVDEPVLMILDSFHWADETNLALLRDMARRLLDPQQAQRVMLLVTYRPDQALQTFVDSERQHNAANTMLPIRLGGVDVEAVAQMVRASDEHTIIQLSSALHQATQGNPLHLSQMMLNAQGMLDAQRLAQDVSATLRQAVEQLPSNLKQIMGTAAVLGHRFEVAQLRSLSDHPDAVFDALRSAQQAGFISESNPSTLEYRFRHDLCRDTLYQSLSAADRAYAHERIAQWMERTGVASDTQQAAHLIDLAKHFAAAASLGHRDKAQHYLSLAAQQANASLSYDSAKALFEQSLDFTDRDQEPQRWCDLSTGLGEALHGLGDARQRELLLEVADYAEQIGDGERMANALLRVYRGTFSRALQVDVDFVARLRRALQLLGNVPTDLRARLLSLLSVETAWEADRQQSEQAANDALTIAEALDDSDLLATTLAQRQWVIYHPIEERVATTNRLATLLSDSRDPQLRFEAAGTDVFTRIRCGDADGYQDALAKLRDSAAQLDLPIVQWMLTIREAAHAMMVGDYANAKQQMKLGRELGTATAQPDSEQQYIAQRFWHNFDTQPPDQARPVLSGMVGMVQSPAAPSIWGPALLRCCDLGLEQQAATLLEAILQPGFEQLPKDQTWLCTLSQLASAAHILQDQTLAAELIKHLTPYQHCHANIVFYSMGSVARYLAQAYATVGDTENAAHFWHQAVADNERFHAVAWTARCQIDAARFQLTQGVQDPQHQQWLGQALNTAQQFNLPTVIEQAEYTLTQLASGNV